MKLNEVDQSVRGSIILPFLGFEAIMVVVKGSTSHCAIPEPLGYGAVLYINGVIDGVQRRRSKG